MVGLLSVAPLLCGSLVAVCIMYTLKNSRLRDTQGRFLGLMIFILSIGVLVIISGYRGLIRPFVVGNESSETLAISSGLHNSGRLDTLASTLIEQPDEHIYGIMFDAGSTGSRIHVFKFKQVDPNKPFEFVDELFEKVQPGLSSYADQPKQAAESLKGMMDKAKKYIPEKQWSSTPIALKATAGLRKLKPQEADNILNEVKQLFVEYPFKQYDDSVVIMEGTSEGVFSWFTVNFYSGVLGDSQKMQGVMDLGGGSTQITFTPNDQLTISSAPAAYISDTDILGKKLKLYTHSYLDLGLMAGRLQIMGGKVGGAEQAPLPALTSPCFPETYKGKIQFGQDEYTIHGSKPSVSRHIDCLSASKAVVSKYDLHTSAEIQHKPFCAISYYFDRAVEAGLIKEEKGGIVKVGDFSAAARRVCDGSSMDNPFLCLDLCYLTSLLQDGFKMSEDNALSVQKQINGEEISWALGAMFDFIGNHNKRS